MQVGSSLISLRRSSVAGWAVWGRRTFIWTLVSGVGLTVVAVVIMGIIGD